MGELSTFNEMGPLKKIEYDCPIQKHPVHRHKGTELNLNPDISYFFNV